MNTHLRPPHLPLTTQAAEGLERRRWSVAEIEAMVEAGVIDEDERFELIGGEVVPMSPKGFRHELVKMSLARHFHQKAPRDVLVAHETTFRLSEDTFVEPDFVFYRRADGLAALSPATCLLAVEVADTSLSYDLGRKSVLYRAMGVREAWVVEAHSLVTHVRREPRLDGWREEFEVPADQTLRFSFAPPLDLKLAELELV